MERRTYVCKRARMCSYLVERGFMPYKIKPDCDNPKYDVYLFTATPELHRAVMAYLESSIPMTNTAVDFILEGINRYLLELAREQIRLAFDQAEKEVEDLHQRTREGIQTARLNGKQIGQRQGAKLTTKKSIAAKEVILRHSKDFGGTLADVDVIKLTGLARNTYFKYKRELREDKE